MVTVTNIGAGEVPNAIGSISNPEADQESAALPAEIAELPGSTGTATAGNGISAPDLLVRGTRPFARRAKKIGPGLESILGDDDRTRILDTDFAPWRMICSLDIRAKSGTWVGTGWFAGPRTVVTAGHCVFSAQMGGWAKEIIVRPGRSGNRAPFGELTSKRFSATDRWVTAAEPDFDYAAIHLGEHGDIMTAQTGWFSTLVLNDAALAAQRVNVAGYPVDKGGDTQWFHAKQIVYTTEHRIFYDVDTVAGQSGAPAWLDSDVGPRVVGIHAYGIGASIGNVVANSAPRITEPVLDRIREWLFM